MSALRQRLTDYLALRRALGYRLVDHGRQLASFVDYLDDRGEPTVTVTAALAWASSSGASDGQTEVPPADLLRARHERTTPYLYAPEEIAALVAAARRVQPALHGATIATVVGLMAATGLRTGEAVALDRADVDLAAGTLTVRDAKWRKTRQVPIHATVAAALDDYRQLRDTTLPDAPADAFFVSRSGRRLTAAELTRRFRGLRDDLGIHAPPYRRPPRLYDLRHSFAVGTLVDWHAAGVDVQARLPVLSTYLGHLNPASTYWYLQAAPELLGVVARRVERAAGARR